MLHNPDPAPWPEGANWSLDDRATLLIVASGIAQAEIGAMASGAGFRVAGAVAPEGLAERLAQTVGLDVLLVDMRGRGESDPALARLMADLLSWPGWCDARPVLLVDLACVETVAATLSIRLDRMLCEPSLSTIAAELCLLARLDRQAPHLSDSGGETDATRLEQLSAEVRRLAETIDRLARRDDGAGSPGLRDRDPGYMAAPTALPDTRPERVGATREEVSRLLNARRMRDRFLPGELFADPAWDMMLDLLGARIDGKRVSVSSLCIAAAVPPTTALRWITLLTDRGIFERSNDPDDARRVFISLSDEAARSLSGWFAAVRKTGMRFVA